MAFSDRTTENTKGMDDAVDTAVKAAINTFQSSIAAELTTHGASDAEKTAFDDKLIDLTRWLTSTMREND